MTAPAKEELVAHYEALRGQVLGTREGAGALGWALLVRRGIAAWMAAWSKTASPAAAKVRSEGEAVIGPMPELQSELVVVLAGMALHQIKEKADELGNAPQSDGKPSCAYGLPLCPPVYAAAGG